MQVVVCYRSHAGQNGGNMTISLLYYRNVSGKFAGGICGQYAGKSSGDVEISDCQITGNITGEGAGGICGQYAGSNGTVTIYNCYTVGIISGYGVGGICGEYAGDNGGTATIYNCYTEGDISGYSSGGICGLDAGANGGTAIIYNCYTDGDTTGEITGEISGQDAGGICGQNAGYDGTAIIYNCYTKGKISGTAAGGICGSIAGSNGTVTIYNCYTKGEISGEFSGGICGEYAGYYDGKVEIYNCYTTGKVSGLYTGGICGEYAGYDGGTVTVTNCISQTVDGNITTGSSDGVYPMDGTTTQKNSIWDDCNAKDTIGTIVDVDDIEEYELRWHIPSLTSGSDPSPWFICGDGDESNVISSGSGSCNFSNLECETETGNNNVEAYTSTNDTVVDSHIQLSGYSFEDITSNNQKCSDIITKDTDNLTASGDTDYDTVLDCTKQFCDSMGNKCTAFSIQQNITTANTRYIYISDSNNTKSNSSYTYYYKN